MKSVSKVRFNLDSGFFTKINGGTSMNQSKGVQTTMLYKTPNYEPKLPKIPLLSSRQFISGSELDDIIKK